MKLDNLLRAAAAAERREVLTILSAAGYSYNTSPKILVGCSRTLND